MGTTRREEMMLEAIDAYLAREPLYLQTAERIEQESANKNTLAQILSQFAE